MSYHWPARCRIDVPYEYRPSYQDPLLGESSEESRPIPFYPSHNPRSSPNSRGSRRPRGSHSNFTSRANTSSVYYGNPIQSGSFIYPNPYNMASGMYNGCSAPYCPPHVTPQLGLYNVHYGLPYYPHVTQPGPYNAYYGNTQYQSTMPGHINNPFVGFVRLGRSTENNVPDVTTAKLSKTPAQQPYTNSLSHTGRISLVGVPFNICDSIAEVYRPRLLRYPEFIDHVTEMKLNHLQQAPRLDHQHVGKVWLGLTTAKAEELMHLEHAFKTALEDLLQDQLSFISQCIDAGRPPRKDKHGNVRHLTVSLLDIVNKLERYYKEHIDKFRWVTSLGSIYKTLARFVCTHDCFVCTDPSSDSPDRLSVGIDFHPAPTPTGLVTAPTSGSAVEAVWYPDHISIDPSGRTAREGERFILYPYHNPSIHPGLSPNLAQRELHFETSTKWLKWDPTISAFVGNVPFFSEVEEDELNVGDASLCPFNLHRPFTLPVEIALTIYDYFGQTVRYQQTFKARARIVVERKENVSDPSAATHAREIIKRRSNTSLSRYYRLNRADYEDFPVTSKKLPTETEYGASLLKPSEDGGWSSPSEHAAGDRTIPIPISNPVPAYLGTPALQVFPGRLNKASNDEDNGDWSTDMSIESQASPGSASATDPEKTITGRSSHPFLIRHEDKARFAETLREMMEEERGMLGSDIEDVFMSTDDDDSVIKADVEEVYDESDSGLQYGSGDEYEDDAGGYEGDQGVALLSDG